MGHRIKQAAAALALSVVGVLSAGQAVSAQVVTSGDQVAQISTCDTAVVADQPECLGTETGEQINGVAIALIIVLVPLMLGIWLAWRAIARAQSKIRV